MVAPQTSTATATKPIQAPATTGQVVAPAATSSPPPEIYPSVDLVQKICPDSPRANIAQNLPYILKEMAVGGLVSRNQLIAIIATIYTEVRQFESVPEYGDNAYFTKYYEGRDDLGNTQPGDGVKFSGRGFIQITGRSNATALTKLLKIDFVSDPDLALKPEVAAKVLVAFWKGACGNNPQSPAEAGRWEAVRRAVNGGTNHLDIFLEAVARGQQHFTKGIDPSSIATLPLPGNYGLGCVDSGQAGDRTIMGMNPSNQLDALSYALGIHARDRENSRILRAQINIADLPEILDLDIQKKFTAKNFGKDLDGEYIVDELHFEYGDSLEVTLHAKSPDANAPSPQVFLHNTQAGLTNPTSNVPGAVVPVGDLPSRIFNRAKEAKGSSSASGPGGGNVACAWCVNRIVLQQAIGHMIGDNPDYVPAVEDGLKGGFGQKVDRAQAVPGDIWISPGQAHIGICTSAGCATVLSNSSSRAAFSWEDAIDSVNGYYGGGSESIYRVIK